MSKNISAPILVTEYLNVTAAMTPTAGPVAWITVRQKEGSWETSNLGFTAQQAHRLMRDLERLFEDVPQLGECLEKGKTTQRPKRRR